MTYDPTTGEIKTISTERGDLSTKDKKKGIIYARVSTEEQKIKGNGIPAQIIDCEKWAKYNDVVIIGEPFIDEAISGQNLQRKNFQAAIKFLEKENKSETKIDYFICGSTSRFSRSHKINETFDMVARVEATGAKLVAVGNGGVQDIDSEEWLVTTTLNFLIDAIESKRGEKRVRYGQKAKIYEWLRPFPAAPFGYERIKKTTNGKEIKYLIKKEPEASILKEGLELFADWVLLTKKHLSDFFEERGIRSNSHRTPKNGKTGHSFVDKMLDLRKLQVYTGYVNYPDRWIYEKIPAQHPALISEECANKIAKRLYKDWDILNHKKRGYDQDADEYPLKRILLCPECHKWVTKRKSKSETGDYHHYYWCNTPWCKLFKKGLRRDEVHEALKQRLLAITPSEWAIKLFEAIFKEEQIIANKDINSINREKQNKIMNIQKEMGNIEKVLDNITDPALFKKKQEQWSTLNQQLEDLQFQILDQQTTADEYEKILNEAKYIISNPVSIREIEDVETKQLLIRVCFNNKIYYDKKEWLHTPEISVIYSLIQGLSDNKTLNLEV